MVKAEFLDHIYLINDCNFMPFTAFEYFFCGGHLRQTARAKRRKKTAHPQTAPGKRINRMRMKSLKNVCRKDNENLMLWNVMQLFFLCGVFRTFSIKILTMFS